MIVDRLQANLHALLTSAYVSFGFRRICRRSNRSSASVYDFFRGALGRDSPSWRLRSSCIVRQTVEYSRPYSCASSAGRTPASALPAIFALRYGEICFPGITFSDLGARGVRCGGILTRGVIDVGGGRNAVA